MIVIAQAAKAQKQNTIPKVCGERDIFIESDFDCDLDVGYSTGQPKSDRSRF